ncbi:MAG: tetratricopeptide repeat protein [Acidobacteria bacterium]|nr:tetratricopeptide repeat protein [Acidobacteriota bacterium]
MARIPQTSRLIPVDTASLVCGGLAFGLCLLLSGACQRRPTEPGLADQLLAAGHQALGAGKLDEAESSFKEALEALEVLPDAHHGLAKVRRRQGRTADAIASLKKALDIDGTYNEARLELADCYEGAGDIANAMKILSDALEFDPFVPDAEHALARIRMKQRKPYTARLHLKRAYVLAPVRYAPDYDAAQRPIEFEPGADDTEAAALTEQTTLVRVARLQSALQAWKLAQTALEEKPRPSRASLSMAIEALESSLRGHPYDLLIGKALLLLYKWQALNAISDRQPDEAMKSYIRAQFHRTDVETVLAELGEMPWSEKRGRKGEIGASFLRRAVMLGAPADDKMTDKIRELWPPALPLNPPSRGESLLGCLERIQTANKAGPRGEVEATARRCVEALPREATLAVVLGTVYLEAKDFDRAALFLWRGIEMAPDESARYVNLGQALFRAGRRDEAVAVVQFALQHATDPEARALLGANLSAFQSAGAQ